MLTFSESQLIDWISPLLWPFLRVLAVFTTMPVFSQRAVPLRVRIGLAGLIAFAAQAMLPEMPRIALDSPTAFVAIAQQLLVGMSIGFAVRIVFAAIEFAGELIGLQMGLNYAGFFDPATRIGLEENDEDFGQTLGRWGVGEGPYLVLPLFGPRTLRSAAGDVADSPLTPLIDITSSDIDIAWVLWTTHQVDKRSRLLDADEQVFEAYDPYLFVRDAYLQNQRYRLHDGNPPEDDSYLDDMDDE